MKYVSLPKRRNVFAEQMATLSNLRMQNLSINATQSIPTPFNPSQLNSAQRVSWRSAYWALIGLALNTFTQSPGKVLGFPEKSDRCLRTSPVICLADTTLILLEYLAFLWKGKNHVDSARCIVEQREFEPTTGRDEKTWWFKTVVFFGALTQAVKLFGMHGIIATQVIGMTYLVSYAVIEVLLRSAGSDSRTDSIPEPSDKKVIERLDKGLKACNITMIQLQRIVWTWIISSLGSDEMVQSRLGIGGTASSRTLLQRILHVTTIASNTLCLGLCAAFLASCAVYGISCCCGCLPMVNYTYNIGTKLRGIAKSIFLSPDLGQAAPDSEQAAPDLQLARQESPAKSRIFLKLVLFNLLTHGAHVAIWIPHFPTWDHFYYSLNLARLAIAFGTLICAMLVHFLAFTIGSCLYYLIQRWYHPRGQNALTPVHPYFAYGDDTNGAWDTAEVRQIFVVDDFTRAWAAFHFAAMNIIVGMLYYAYLYDPKDTGKLPWTDNLG